MTNFPTILNRLIGMFSEDRSEFIASFDEYDLLIIDDLGVERSTEYAIRTVNTGYMVRAPTWSAAGSRSVSTLTKMTTEYRRAAAV